MHSPYYKNSQVTFKSVIKKAQFKKEWDKIPKGTSELYLYLHGGVSCLYFDGSDTVSYTHLHYVRFVDREDDKPKNQWKTNDDWAWFVGENREPIRLTTKPEPYTLQKALHWLQRQVAPTIKMVQALDRENHTTILKDMIEQAELKDKHKHLLQLEKSTIEERIDTAIPQENDDVLEKQ